MTYETVVAKELDPKRLEDLFLVGVDEISYRKHHNYLTLATNHDTRKIVYGSEGKSASSLDGFFDELGAEQAAKIAAGTFVTWELISPKHSLIKLQLPGYVSIHFTWSSWVPKPL